jgi:hypothetical protein
MNPIILEIAGVSLIVLGAIAGAWRLLRCAHAWELVDKTEFPPPIETFMRHGGTHNISGFLGVDQAERISRRTVAIVLRCTKCGVARIHKIQA